MKTKDIIIGVLTIAVVILGILLYKAMEREDTSNYQTHSRIKNSTLNFLCKENVVFKDGDIVSSKTAFDTIRAFEIANPKDQILAFHFGLENLNKLIEKVKHYNNQNKDDSIVGFRFYKILSSRKFIGETGNEILLTKQPDLIIVPSLARGPLHDYNTNADVPIIWHSRPCPKLCKKR